MRKFTLLFSLMLLCITSAMAAVVDELNGKVIVSIGQAVSQVESGQWYVLRNNGRVAYVVKESGGLKMRQRTPAGTRNYGYLFKIESTGTDGQYTIKTYEGQSIKLAEDASSVTDDENAFTIGNITGTYFYIQQVSDGRLADGQQPDYNFVGWGTTVPTSTTSNAAYQFIPVTLEDLVTVTYNYTIDGRAYATRNVEVRPGTTPQAPQIPFVTINSIDKNDAITEAVTINVDCDENLPFQVSTSFADAKWQFIDMHSNDNGTAGIANGTKNYIWTFQAVDKDILLPQDDTKQTAKPADTKMWAFVGNLVDGFKIYNKAAGEGLTLRKATNGNTAVVMSATNDRNVFKIYASNAITGATAFKLDGDNYYVNTQKPGENKVLRGWTDADGGSSCRFFAPAHYMLANLSVDLQTTAQTISDNADDIAYLREAGALGMPGADVDFNALNTELNAYRSIYNPDELNDTELMAKINNANASIAPSFQIEEGKLYRLKNFCRILPNTNPLDDFNGGFVSYEPTNDANFSCHTTGKDQAGAIFKFEQVEGGYKIYDLNGKGYIGKTNATTASQYVSLTTNADDAGIYNIAQQSLGQFNLICTNSGGTISQKYLHASGAGLMNWNDGGASRFFIIPAVDIVRSLNAAGSAHYATAYLPFDVEATGETKLYTAKQNANDAAVVDAVETTTVPAEQGFIIEGTEGTVTLNIVSNATAIEGNILTGTLQNKTIEDKTSFYVFSGNEDGTVGFYRPNSTTLAANKAYIDESAAASDVAGFVLNFGGTQTGIQGAATIEGNNAAQPVYDLSGRRVVNPARGIYIQGGKKILVK